MSSLWRTKKDGEANAEDTSSNAANSSRPTSADLREPDERSRLLPTNNQHPYRSDGYLDPDDPAVCTSFRETIRF